MLCKEFAFLDASEGVEVTTSVMALQVHHLKRRREDMAGTMKRKRRGAVASVQGSAGSSLSDLQSVVPSFLQVDFT